MTAEYLAGLFDGEGCVTMRSPKTLHDGRPKIVVKLGVVGREIPDMLREQFGGSITRQNGRGNQKALYGWRVIGRRAARFLSMIRPWCIIKSRAIEIGLSHLVLEMQPRAIRTHRGRVRSEIKQASERLMADLRRVNMRGLGELNAREGDTDVHRQGP